MVLGGTAAALLRLAAMQILTQSRGEPLLGVYRFCLRCVAIRGFSKISHQSLGFSGRTRTFIHREQTLRLCRQPDKLSRKNARTAGDRSPFARQACLAYWRGACEITVPQAPFAARR
ncbi:MAG: hypothetical protein WBL57_04320, partial [Methylovirgula sp.]